MLAFCPNCWNGINSSPMTCRNCGTHVDVYSHEYERELVSLLGRSSAEKRAEICLVLGHREKRSAIPHLIDMLTDPDALVRIAALGALGKIGDSSAVPALKKVAANDDTAIRTFATQVITTLEAHGSKQRRQRRT